MLLQPRPTSLSPAHISSHLSSHLSSHHRSSSFNRSSSFTFFTPSILTNRNTVSSTPTSPQLKNGSISINEKVPSTPSLHTITVVSVSSHPLPQQNAIRIDMKLCIPISLFTPTQQAALATVKQRELIAMKKRKRNECTLKGCICVSCKEESINEVETCETPPSPQIISIASATSAFKKLRSSSTPSSPPSKSTSIPSSPPSKSTSAPLSPPSKSTSIPSSPPSTSPSTPSSPYDDDHLLFDLSQTFRNHKSWYANPFNTKKPPKPIPKKNENIIIKDEIISSSYLSPPNSTQTISRTLSPPSSYLSLPNSTQTISRTLSPHTLSPHSLVSTGLSSTDYVYRDVNVVIPATSSMDVAIQVHKHSIKICCAEHTFVTLNPHHLFTF